MIVFFQLTLQYLFKLYFAVFIHRLSSYSHVCFALNERQGNSFFVGMFGAHCWSHHNHSARQTHFALILEGRGQGLDGGHLRHRPGPESVLAAAYYSWLRSTSALSQIMTSTAGFECQQHTGRGHLIRGWVRALSPAPLPLVKHLYLHRPCWSTPPATRTRGFGQWKWDLRSCDFSKGGWQTLE